MPFLLPSLRGRGLRFQLTMVILILLGCSMGSVYLPYYWGRESLKQDLEKSFLDLSNAIRVSVDQLTAPAAGGKDVLQSYVESLRRSGIREVSIVGEDMGVIDSTNPKAIGKTARIKLPPEKLVINATFGDEPGEGEGKLQSRDLVVPVTVGGDTLGYIHVRMHIDDFTNTIRRNLYLRLVSTLLIFSMGLVLAITISSRYVKPLENLALASEKVAAGDLSLEIPVRGGGEVGRLTRVFNEMIVKLRQNRELEEKILESQYLSQLGRLSSGVAHEIRNPLNFIGLAVDRLDDLTCGRTPEGGKEKEDLIRRIKTEIKRLNDLVTNFIMYGRPPQPRRSPVRLDEIAGSVLGMADGRLRAQGIELCADLPADLPVMADPDMIRRAVLNIVSNAVDAMPDGGRLRVSAGRRDGGWRGIVVEDTGVGIPEEDRERIFEPYFTTKVSGLGLGLVLTRKIVEAHGGRILVESRPGRGTRIEVLLPGETASQKGGVA